MENIMLQLDYKFLLSCAIRIILSFCTGSILGLERKFRQHIIGLRTLILISEAATLLGILSLYVPSICPGDAERIAAQVVSGIGFLGGGAILKQGMNIRGLTTAAIIWAAAAIGLSIGMGLYIPALLCVMVAVLSLIILERFEDKHFPRGRVKSLHITFSVTPEKDLDMSELKTAIEKHGFTIADFNMSRIIASNLVILHYSVKAPKKDDFSALVNELGKIGILTEFSITD
ncbi:MAG: MgtC/SapB family protein [Treponema sp.]|nr:MgtC/SapB family protein [Treponema sp.]